MKKLLTLFFVAVIILSLNCGKKEAEIKLSLTNPQDLAIPFNGYYKLAATGDSVAMKDHTPKEYTFILKKGESASGIVYKDTADFTDTLHFRILQDDSEIMSKKMTSILDAVQFQVTAQ
ncbi:MAG: hypothetical protein ACETVX_01100 [bacterium]|nr:hypothetical protein [candidate division WOR-3 bacterium]MDH5684238.1 hypothetical protein [candidate division WOR-3 bacterium]